MQYLHGDDKLVLPAASVLTLGKFDGVHLGHQKLIRKVDQIGKEKGLLTAAFTFDTIPASILPDGRKKFLSTNEERRVLFERLGLQYELEFPFTPHLMHMSPEDFVDEVLLKRLKAKAVVVGEDYHFGAKRVGDADTLRRLGREKGFEVFVLQKELWHGQEISSTLVRQKLLEGRLEEVSELLGRPYSVLGVTQKGNQLGRQLGMPTLNLYPPKSKLLPPDGVYASRTKFRGKVHEGVTDIGFRPTITSGDTQIRVETNLFDWEPERSDNFSSAGDSSGNSLGNLSGDYGVPIEVSLYKFVRGDKKFADLTGLKDQMKADKQAVREFFLKTK